ncbi:MAG: ATP-binding protein [Inhella sp.]
MNRLFWRLLPLTLLALLAASAVLYVLFSRLYGDPLEDIARRQAAAQLFVLEHYIDAAPRDEWLERLNKVREVSPQRYELLPLDEALQGLGSAQQQRLREGTVVLDVAGRRLLRRVDLQGERYVDSEREVLRISGLPIDVAQALRQEALRWGVVALFLLVPLALWSRLHWRGLLALSRTAEAWGAGHLSARAEAPASTSLQPLAQGMNQMAERLAALLEGRRHLLHAVSHELRTPIARMGFDLELLRDTDNPAARHARIDALERDLAQLQALVTELLSYSRLEQAQLQREPFELEDLLRQCLGQQEVESEARELQVQIAPDIGRMQGDAHLVARVVGNLLGNALKYARHQVRFSARALPAAQWELRVEDDGPGIPEGERQRVFEPFVRLPQTGNLPGHGLGLAIAARGVALHGGAIQIEKSALGGACLVVRWPRGGQA